MLTFLEGKKTYLAAAALVLLAVGGYWYGLVPPVEATAIAALGFGLFGLGDKSDRYAQLLLARIEELKQKQAEDPVDRILKRATPVKEERRK